MSEKYLIGCEPEQVPPYEPQAIAQGLGLTLLSFLGPLLLELDQRLDKRLIRTFVQTIEAILTFRDRVNGLLLSELGNYLDSLGKGGGTKRLSRLLHSSKWTAAIIDRFLWWRASQQVEQWDEQADSDAFGQRLKQSNHNDRAEAPAVMPNQREELLDRADFRKRCEHTSSERRHHFNCRDGRAQVVN